MGDQAVYSTARRVGVGKISLRTSKLVDIAAVDVSCCRIASEFLARMTYFLNEHSRPRSFNKCSPSVTFGNGA